MSRVLEGRETDVTCIVFCPDRPRSAGHVGFPLLPWKGLDLAKLQVLLTGPVCLTCVVTCHCLQLGCQQMAGHRGQLTGQGWVVWGFFGCIPEASGILRPVISSCRPAFGINFLPISLTRVVQFLSGTVPEDLAVTRVTTWALFYVEPPAVQEWSGYLKAKNSKDTCPFRANPSVP